MQVSNGAPFDGLTRIDLENVGAVVLGLRMVRHVHADGVHVVVDGDVDVPAEGLFDCGGHAAATSKQVDDDFVVHT